MSNDEAMDVASPASSSSPETTPEMWDRMRAFLRSMPSADSISRTPAALAREAQVVQEFLSQQLPLPQLFLALDQATRQGEGERTALVAQVIFRCFLSPKGLSLLNDPSVLPSLSGGLRHPDAEIRKLAARVLVKNLQAPAAAPAQPAGQAQAEGGTAAEGEESPLQLRVALVWRLLGSEEVLAALVQGVADSSIAVGQFAADALLALVTPPPPSMAAAAADTTNAAAAAAAAAPVVMARVSGAAGSPPVDKDSVLRLRYAELVAKAMAASEEALAAATIAPEGEKPACEVLFELAEGKDVLIQFSALELLEQVASSPAGVRYLFERGTVDKLLALATGGGGGSEPHPVLGGTALRVLGAVYKTLLSDRTGGSAATLDGGQVVQVMSTVLRYAESGRDADKLAALQVICAFASAPNPAALRLITEDPVLLRDWLDLRPAKVEMKAAALHALARVLRGQGASSSSSAAEDTASSSSSFSSFESPSPPTVPAPASGTEAGSGSDANAPERETPPVGREASPEERERSDLRRLLFSRVGELNGAASTMAFLQTQLRAPIPAIRHAVYDVLVSVAEQAGGWGVRAMFTTAGFREFLESRSTELDKVGKEWKFALVQRIVHAQRAEPVLNEEILGGLRVFLRQGPFYVSRQAEVETMT